jgi:uncharacterized membrane protein YraQ (UPF0718 family)
MKMPGFDISLVIIWTLVAVLAVLAWRRGEGRLQRGLRRGFEMFLVNGPRVVVALLAAGFLSYFLPKDLIAEWLGHESGWQGILIGSVVGPFFPGGPLVIFPVLVALLKAGAGLPSVFAFLTSASVWGVHRIIMFEIPMMGPRFAAARMIASLALPPLSGFMAIIVIRLLGAPAGFNP